MPHSDFCSECNPFGEVILTEVQCPAGVAINGECNFTLTSSNTSALALELQDFTLNVPGGTIIAPTNANLGFGSSVNITLRRLNDGASQTFVYTVQDTCP